MQPALLTMRNSRYLAFWVEVTLQNTNHWLLVRGGVVRQPVERQAWTARTEGIGTGRPLDRAASSHAAMAISTSATAS